MLIFLDIDGVMVPAKSWEKPPILNDGFMEFSIKAVRVLQNLISDEVTVILTTSHKSSYSINEWKSIFLRRGIEITNLQKLNDNTLGFSRKDEIVHWFNQNNIAEDFIIIDDDKSLNALPNFLKDYLILTSPMIALNDIHLQEIKSKLSNKLMKYN